MNELIVIDQDGRITARELYEFLEMNPANFSHWSKRNIVENDFASEGIDWVRLVIQNETPTGGQIERDDYRLTIDFAKKLCMVSKSPKGEQARNYFIEVERRYKTQVMQLPQNYADALRELATTWEQKEIALKQLEAAKPKVEFYDAVANSKTAIPMAHAAKVLEVKGIGRNKLFGILRDKKILDRGNVPYQEFIDRGYFRTIEQKYTTPAGETKIDIRTLVYQRGLDFIRKIISA